MYFESCRKLLDYSTSSRFMNIVIKKHLNDIVKNVRISNKKYKCKYVPDLYFEDDNEIYIYS
jgi:hypothetical protein